MRRILLCAGLVLAALALLLFPGYLKKEIRQGIEEVFPGSKVTVGRFAFERPLALAISGISVRSKEYEISLGRVVLSPGLDLDVYDPVVTLRKLPQTPAEKSGAGSPVAIRMVKIHRLVLNYRVEGLTAELKGDLTFDLAGGRLVDAGLSMPVFKRGNLSIENAALEAGEGREGTLKIGSISQQKIKISALRAQAELGKDALKLTGVEAAFSGGAVMGTADLFFTSPFSYQAELTISLMDLSVLAKELELEAKVGLGGRIDGKLSLSGDAGGVRKFTGAMSGTQSGGDVVINDKATLENLAKNVKQPIEMVEAAFREYHFDTATAGLELEGRDLGLSVHLEGERGKRDLKITLHDFL